MAKQMIKGLAMLVLVVMLSLVTASATKAQSSRQVANIPFDFVVGSEELQAGEYRVETVSSTGMAMKISGEHQGCIASHRRSRRAAEPKRESSYSIATVTATFSQRFGRPVRVWAVSF
jgi:hypothetical protein